MFHTYVYSTCKDATVVSILSNTISTFEFEKIEAFMQVKNYSFLQWQNILGRKVGDLAPPQLSI